MSILRILLLVPVLYSLLVLVGLGFAISKANAARSHFAAPLVDQAWHEAAMKSEDSVSLRSHAEKLWALFQHADGAAESFLSSTKLALRVAVFGSLFTLVFCTAAFIKAKPPTPEPRLNPGFPPA